MGIIHLKATHKSDSACLGFYVTNFYKTSNHIPSPTRQGVNRQPFRNLAISIYLDRLMRWQWLVTRDSAGVVSRRHISYLILSVSKNLRSVDRVSTSQFRLFRTIYAEKGGLTFPTQVHKQLWLGVYTIQ